MALSPPAKSDIVATVGGTPISTYALRKALIQRGAEINNQFDSIEAKEGVLQELIDREVLAQAAREAGLERDPEIQETLSRLLADRYLRELRQVGAVSPQVTSEETRGYYEAHQADYSAPRRARASVIFLRVPPGASEKQLVELRRQTDALRQEALALDDQEFARLAKKHSNEPETRRRGGDVGWLLEGTSHYRRPQALAKMVFSLKTRGEIGPVVETPKGFYIVRLTDHKPAAARPYAEVEGAIRRHLRAEKRREWLRRHVERLVTRHEVEIHRDVLASVATGRRTSGAERPPSFPFGGPVTRTGGAEPMQTRPAESRREGP